MLSNCLPEEKGPRTTSETETNDRTSYFFRRPKIKVSSERLPGQSQSPALGQPHLQCSSRTPDALDLSRGSTSCLPHSQTPPQNHGWYHSTTGGQDLGMYNALHIFLANMVIPASPQGCYPSHLQPISRTACSLSDEDTDPSEQASGRTPSQGTSTDLGPLCALMIQWLALHRQPLPVSHPTWIQIALYERCPFWGLLDDKLELDWDESKSNRADNHKDDNNGPWRAL